MCIASIEKSRHVNGKLFLLTLKKGTGAKLVNVCWSASYILNVQLVISIAIIVILIQKYLGLQNRSFVFCNLDGLWDWFHAFVVSDSYAMYTEKTPIHLQEIYRYIWTATSFFQYQQKKVPRIQKVFFSFQRPLRSAFFYRFASSSSDYVWLLNTM